MWDFIVGPEIGRGATRTVYHHRFDPDVVVKVCENSTHWHQNLMEWEAWMQIKRKPKVARWFAPCVAISQCGRIMIQKRAHDLNINDVPKMLPHFMDDFSVGNFGRYQNRIVARDYGTVLFGAFEDRINKPLTMKKVRFYE